MDEVLLKVPDVVYEQAVLKIERSRWAAVGFQKLDHAATQRIIRAVAEAGFARAQFYADWAVRETGMGVAADKKLKNEACSRGILDLYGKEDFVSPRIHAASRIVEIPRPAAAL